MVMKPDVSDDDKVYVSEFDKESQDDRLRLSSLITNNPLVPICIAGAGVSLVGGLWAFRSGRSQMSQYFQRARVGFQGAAVLALVVGSWNQHGARDTPAVPAHTHGSGN